MHTSSGLAPTSRADASFTDSSMVTQGNGSSKWPSTPHCAHLSSSATTYSRARAGMHPSELPHM